MAEAEKSCSPTPDARPSPALPYMAHSRTTSLAGASLQGASFTGSEIAEMMKGFEDLGKFAESSLIYSGFIITLVITFLTLANKVVAKVGSIEVEAAMTLCFLACSCHLSIILVSSRACIVAFRYYRLLKSNLTTVPVEEYRTKLEASLRTLRVCEWIQGFGQTLCVPSVLYTVWLMFEHRFLVYMIYGFIGLLQFTVYAGGFWRVSWKGTTLRPLERYLRRFSRRTREDC